MPSAPINAPTTAPNLQLYGTVVCDKGFISGTEMGRNSLDTGRITAYGEVWRPGLAWVIRLTRNFSIADHSSINQGINAGTELSVRKRLLFKD